MTDDLKNSLVLRPSDELLDILASRDEGIWEPEAFPLARQILAERGVEIEKALAQRAKADPPPDDFVVLEGFFREIDGRIVQAALEASGIPVRLIDCLGTSFPTGGVQVEVPSRRAADARQIAAAAASGQLAEALPVECPACGAAGVVPQRAPEPPASAGNVRYRCHMCGHSWE